MKKTTLKNCANVNSNDEAISKSPNLEKSQITKNQLNDLVEIGKIGRVNGLKGRLCFWLSSDFADFLSSGTEVYVKHTSTLESLDSSCAFSTLRVKSFIKQRDKYFIEFVGISSADSAKQYVNAKIYTTKELSRAQCKLKKDEFFYFDIIGLEIIENNENLGIVRDIERIGNIDYFVVEATQPILKSILDSRTKSLDLAYENMTKSSIRDSTNIKINVKNTTKKSSAFAKDSLKKPKNKTFLIPYLDRFVLEISLQKQSIFTQNARAILEQS